LKTSLGKDTQYVVYLAHEASEPKKCIS
jgi:hypothetical protein